MSETTPVLPTPCLPTGRGRSEFAIILELQDTKLIAKLPLADILQVKRWVELIFDLLWKEVVNYPPYKYGGLSERDKTSSG